MTATETEACKHTEVERVRNEADNSEMFFCASCGVEMVRSAPQEGDWQSPPWARAPFVPKPAQPIDVLAEALTRNAAVLDTFKVIEPSYASAPPSTDAASRAQIPVHEGGFADSRTGIQQVRLLSEKDRPFDRVVWNDLRDAVNTNLSVDIMREALDAQIKEGTASNWQVMMVETLCRTRELQDIIDEAEGQMKVLRKILADGIDISEDKSVKCLLGTVTLGEGTRRVKVVDEKIVPPTFKVLTVDTKKVLKAADLDMPVPGTKIDKSEPTLRIKWAGEKE